MAEFRMPVLGADMEAGTVVEYLIRPGEHVAKGQLIAVIDTAKAAIEVEAPVDGVLESIVVPVGQEVPVGTLLATLGTSAAPVPPPAAKSPGAPQEVGAPRTASSGALDHGAPAPAPAREETAHPPAEPPVASPIVRHLAHVSGIDLRTVTPTGPRGVVTRDDLSRVASRVRSSPYARRTAERLGIDLAGVAGSGPRGAVRASDLMSSTGGPDPSAGVTPAAGSAPAMPVRAVPAKAAAANSSARRQAAVAELMSRSKREIPHFYLKTSIDCGPLLDEIGRRNAGLPVGRRLLPAAGLLRAVIKAAGEVPALNGHWLDDSPCLNVSVDLGIAVSLRDGSLVAPALRKIQDASLDEVMARLKEVVGRARHGRLTGDEATDPSITVTNLGDLGVDSVFPIIYRPQIAMVGLGRISNRPWAIGDLLAVRPVVDVTLAVDHRAVNGHQAGLFLGAVERALAMPSEL